MAAHFHQGVQVVRFNPRGNHLGGCGIENHEKTGFRRRGLLADAQEQFRGMGKDLPVNLADIITGEVLPYLEQLLASPLPPPPLFLLPSLQARGSSSRFGLHLRQHPQLFRQTQRDRKAGETKQIAEHDVDIPALVTTSMGRGKFEYMTIATASQVA